MTAKPPTARAVKQLIGRFEVSYNEIVAMMKTLAARGGDPDLSWCASDAWNNADQVFRSLHSLHDAMVSQERRA